MKTLHNILFLLALAGALAYVQPAHADNTTRESTGQYIDDSTITAKIKAKFIGDDVVKTTQIKVTTSQGVVQLSGFVDNKIQKDRAEKLAETTAGVRDVKNDIEVKSS